MIQFAAEVDGSHTRYAMALLDATTVGSYLIDRGTFPNGDIEVQLLSGGVSNVVLLASGSGRRVVVKQALERLRVVDDWRADPARAQVEAAALRYLHRMTPNAVPNVVDDDANAHTLTIAAAPSDWVTWKEELFAGRVSTDVAVTLGRLLRTWHRSSEGAVPAECDYPDLFEQLRLRPYFGTAMDRRPSLSSNLGVLTAALRLNRRCLILGDFSPKNILVGPTGLWVIDLEAACCGDPAFDVAFLLTHLAAKWIHLAYRRHAISAAALAFLDSYADGPGVDDPRHLCQVFGALMLARVVGSSPLPYLLPADARRVERLGTILLLSPRDSIRDAWSLLMRYG